MAGDAALSPKFAVGDKVVVLWSSTLAPHLGWSFDPMGSVGVVEFVGWVEARFDGEDGLTRNGRGHVRGYRVRIHGGKLDGEAIWLSEAFIALVSPPTELVCVSAHLWYAVEASPPSDCQCS